MSLSRITLRLARNPTAGATVGDNRHGYTIIAPLTAGGRLDEDAWQTHKDRCTVRAFAADKAVREGRLARRGNNWFFDYDRALTEDDEPIFKLDRHNFVVGEYVTVTDESDTPLTYRVAQVDPAP